jgi:hypothetical protein
MGSEITMQMALKHYLDMNPQLHRDPQGHAPRIRLDFLTCLAVTEGDQLEMFDTYTLDTALADALDMNGALDTAINP